MVHFAGVGCDAVVDPAVIHDSTLSRDELSWVGPVPNGPLRVAQHALLASGRAPRLGLATVSAVRPRPGQLTAALWPPPWRGGLGRLGSAQSCPASPRGVVPRPA